MLFLLQIFSLSSFARRKGTGKGGEVRSELLYWVRLTVGQQQQFFLMFWGGAFLF